jgi:hypothetical protein
MIHTKRLIALAMNSGPLSERMYFGLPRCENKRAKMATTSLAVMLRSTPILKHSRVYSSTIASLLAGL